MKLVGWLFAALVCLAGGFGYGFFCAKRGFFPHAMLVKLGRADTHTKPRAPIQTRFDTGWFVRTDGAEGSTNDMLSGLDKLGYSQSYQAAGAAGSPYGVVMHDKARAFAGLNLVVSAHEPSALLLDMQGKTLHQWRFEYENVPEPEGFRRAETFGARYWRRARLLPDGGLLAIYDRIGLIRLDRDSRLLWSLSGGYHHDCDVTADGTIYVLQHDVKVIPRMHPTEPTFEDFIVRISPEGEVLERVSLLEAFEKSIYAPLLENRRPSKDIFHTNTLEIFERADASASPLWHEGRALVSIWALDVIALVDLARGEVAWALTGMWHRQHQPVLLENGHMLLFDNLGRGGRSQVIEFDPLTQEVVWRYHGNEEQDLFSALIGSNQRLPNGNTLITESLAGRALEVTPSGEVVWQYLSPFRVGSKDEGVAVLLEVVRVDAATGSGWLR